MKKLVLFLMLGLGFLSKAQTYSFAIYQQEDTLGVVSQSLIPGEKDILFVLPTTSKPMAQAFATAHHLKITPITEYVYNSAYKSNTIRTSIKVNKAPSIKHLTPGQHLVLAGQYQNASIAVGVIGGVVSGLLINKNPEAAGVVAGVSSLVALGLNISSNNHITLAGKKLK